MFTQSCYINENSKELREKLKSLGYKLNHGKAWGEYLACFKTKDTNKDMFVASPDYDLKNMPNFANSIDCGTNEDLFLAIAALQDGTDINQWFTDGKTWKNCMLDKCDIDSWYRCFGYGTTILHKATLQELIEHFK